MSIIGALCESKRLIIKSGCVILIFVVYALVGIGFSFLESNVEKYNGFRISLTIKMASSLIYFLAIAVLSFIFASMISIMERERSMVHRLPLPLMVSENGQTLDSNVVPLVVNLPLNEFVNSGIAVPNLTVSDRNTYDMPPSYEDFQPPSYGEVATNWIHINGKV